MWRKSICLTALLLLVLTPTMRAEDEKKEEDKPSSAAQQLRDLQIEFGKERSELIKEFRAAKTDAEKQKIRIKFFQLPGKFAGRYLEFAEKNADDPVGMQAIMWISSNVRGGPALDKAVGLIAKHHAKSKDIGPIIDRLAATRSPQTAKLLRTVLEQNPSNEIKGNACYALAQFIKNSRPGAEGEAEAEKLLERVVKEFGDVKSRRGTLADIAKGELFEIRNLGYGKVAPEIEGEDLDGVEFKLSDYRGKVVVLDFWGNW